MSALDINRRIVARRKRAKQARQIAGMRAAIEEQRRQMQRELLRGPRSPAVTLKLLLSLDGLITSEAGKALRAFRLSDADFDDLFQEGRMGGLVGIERFDPAREVALSTYANHWIRHYVFKKAAELADVIRVPVHITDRRLSVLRAVRAAEAAEQATGEQGPDVLQYRHNGALERLDLGTHAGAQLLARLLRHQPVRLDAQRFDDGDSTEGDSFADDAPTIEQRMIADEKVQAVRRAVEALEPQDRTVIEARMRGRTLEQIGTRLNLSKERIRQIEEQAQRRLRRARAAAQRRVGLHVR